MSTVIHDTHFLSLDRNIRDSRKFFECSPREIHKNRSRIAAVNSPTVDKTRAGRMRRVS